MRLWAWTWMAFALTACATSPAGTLTPREPATEEPPPEPAAVVSGDPAQVEHGRYLVTLLGCGSCHTDGALIGAPRADRRLAGSSIGIAYSNPLENKYPGVVYPANLTPDRETGLGGWSEEEIVRMVRTGLDRHGRQQLPVMPWPAYSHMSDDDAAAIAAYLMSLEPVVHAVPPAVQPGQVARHPYIHFGVYSYHPD